MSSFPTGLAGGWGLAYDTDANRLWVSNSDAPSAGLHRRRRRLPVPARRHADRRDDRRSSRASGQGDGTYNARTGMIWQANVAYLVGSGTSASSRSIRSPRSSRASRSAVRGEISRRRSAWPTTTRPTPTTWATSSARSPHIDNAGNLLDSGNIGLQISGLAYNPTTRHLFVGELLAAVRLLRRGSGQGYAILSGFYGEERRRSRCSATAASAWRPTASATSGSTTCSTTTVYEVESGESGWCVNDIPWLSEDPASGHDPGLGRRRRGRRAGQHAARHGDVRFERGSFRAFACARSSSRRTRRTRSRRCRSTSRCSSTTCRQDSFAWNFIYGAAGAGVMPGCAPQAPLFAFCPAEVVTRRSMAGYIERAVHGALRRRPCTSAEFDDVLLGSFNADYIQGLVDDGITAGCSVRRGTTARTFRSRGRRWRSSCGRASTAPRRRPPARRRARSPTCRARAASRSTTSRASRPRAITAGCGNGNYCPNASITNAQMAVFLVKAFAIPYLPGLERAAARPDRRGRERGLGTPSQKR